MKYLLPVCLFFLSLVACEKDDAGEGTKISGNGSTDSHNVGTACMQCHNAGGDNEYWFSVAGTIYRSDMQDLFPDCTIFLFGDTLTSASPVFILYGDSKGNFYTTAEISFGSGLYPMVKSKSGNAVRMPVPATSGNCNSCHTEGQRIMVP